MMGNFYTNITVYGVDRNKILSLLTGRHAAVSPTLQGFTVIWDEETESQDITILEALAKQLSQELGCPALAVLNHDDDLLLYLLFLRGNKVEQYNSCPDYFGPSNSHVVSGRPHLLAQTFGVDFATESVDQVLSKEYAFAIERHQALVEALGMPRFAVGMGYTYLTQGEIPQDLENLDAITLCD